MQTDSRRRSAKRPREHLAVAIYWPVIFLICAIVIGFCVKFALDKREDIDASIEKLYPTRDALECSYTHNPDDPIFVYVFTDPDTDKQYLVSDHGGITPRLESDESFDY